MKFGDEGGVSKRAAMIIPSDPVMRALILSRANATNATEHTCYQVDLGGKDKPMWHYEPFTSDSANGHPIAFAAVILVCLLAYWFKIMATSWEKAAEKPILKEWRKKNKYVFMQITRDGLLRINAFVLLSVYIFVNISAGVKGFNFLTILLTLMFVFIYQFYSIATNRYKNAVLTYQFFTVVSLVGIWLMTCSYTEVFGPKHGNGTSPAFGIGITIFALGVGVRPFIDSNGGMEIKKNQSAINLGILEVIVFFYFPLVLGVIEGWFIALGKRHLYAVLLWPMYIVIIYGMVINGMKGKDPAGIFNVVWFLLLGGALLLIQGHVCGISNYGDELAGCAFKIAHERVLNTWVVATIALIPFLLMTIGTSSIAVDYPMEFLGNKYEFEEDKKDTKSKAFYAV